MAGGVDMPFVVKELFDSLSISQCDCKDAFGASTIAALSLNTDSRRLPHESDNYSRFRGSTTACMGAVLVVTIDNPPVNALGVAVREGLAAAIAQAAADAAVAGCADRWARARPSSPVPTSANLASPPCPLRCPRCATPSKTAPSPWWRVLHGAALGGGLEVALSAHYRLALPRRQAGPARSEAGPAARRRRHAARPAPDGREGRHRADAQRQAPDGQGRCSGRLWSTSWWKATTCSPQAWPTPANCWRLGAAVRRTRDIEITDKVGRTGRAGSAGHRHRQEGAWPVLAAEDHRMRQGGRATCRSSRAWPMSAPCSCSAWKAPSARA